jgi:hypothetical protein
MNCGEKLRKNVHISCGGDPKKDVRIYELWYRFMLRRGHINMIKQFTSNT